MTGGIKNRSSDRDDGRLAIEIAGEAAICDWRGAAYFPASDLLVFSDLHLEKGSSFARRGKFVPPYDSHQTLKRVAAVVTDYNPRAVICLGDSFHDETGHNRIPAEIADEIATLSDGRDWCWISGNHDPYAPTNLPGFSCDELSIGALTFRHEPLNGPAAGEIAGHLHPSARVFRRGRTVRRTCFASDGQRMIMPAFGAFTGSLNVLAPAYQPLFEWSAFSALLLGDRRIYPIAAAMLAHDRSSAPRQQTRRRA